LKSNNFPLAEIKENRAYCYDYGHWISFTLGSASNESNKEKKIRSSFYGPPQRKTEDKAEERNLHVPFENAPGKMDIPERRAHSIERLNLKGQNLFLPNIASSANMLIVVQRKRSHTQLEKL
jgi:hypothetical protein